MSTFLALLLLLPSIFFLIYKQKWLSFTGNRNNPSPPSPPKFPIIGNLHQLGKFPHRSLHSLSQRYGNLMLLHLGSKPTLVVSSPDVAKEIMKTHDIIFANRPNLRFITRIFYDANELAFGRYDEKWRRMKSIAVTQLLSTKKVQSFRGIREEEVRLLVEKIRSFGGTSCVNLSRMLLRLTNDLVSRTTFGRKYRIDDDGGVDFEELFKEMVELMGAISVGDFIPWLGWIDRIRGLQNRVERVRRSFDGFLDKVVKEHVGKDNCVNSMGSIDDDKVGEKGEKIKDFVDVLLQVQRDDPNSLSKYNIYGLILDIIGGATDSTQILLEWAMTEVLRNPRVMKQLQQEVRNIGKGKKGITEDDLGNMHYLKAVIKETLRLHPPVPLLLFRESSQNVEINGYEIVSGKPVIINAWAIQRDPNSWAEPEIFKPERFLINSSMDFKGQCFEYIPFGAGRRGCPGSSYGLASAELVLANLVYEFDWKLPNGVELESLDVEESAGITTHRRHPLNVIAIPYFYN